MALKSLLTLHETGLYVIPGSESPAAADAVTRRGHHPTARDAGLRVPLRRGRHRARACPSTRWRCSTTPTASCWSPASTCRECVGCARNWTRSPNSDMLLGQPARGSQLLRRQPRAHGRRRRGDRSVQGRRRAAAVQRRAGFGQPRDPAAPERRARAGDQAAAPVVDLVAPLDGAAPAKGGLFGFSRRARPPRDEPLRACPGGPSTADGDGRPPPSGPRDRDPTRRALRRAAHSSRSGAAGGTPAFGDSGADVGPEPAHRRLGKLKVNAVETLFERLGTRLNDPNLDEAALAGPRHRRTQPDRRREQDPAERPGAQAADPRGAGRRARPRPAGAAARRPGHHRDHGQRPGQDLRRARPASSARCPIRFDDEDHLRRVIDRIVTRVGRRIDESSPLVDARLADGSRVNAIIPPLAFSGSTLTIRKFSTEALSVPDLIGLGTLSPEMAELLAACVAGPAQHHHLRRHRHRQDHPAQRALLASSRTASASSPSRTPSSSSCSRSTWCGWRPAAERRGQGRGHHPRPRAATPCACGPTGSWSARCRGGEALDMLQAMNTGHDGSLSTVHANSPRDAIARLETLVLMAGMDLPLRAIREQISSAVDVVVHLARLRDGTRRVDRRHRGARHGGPDHHPAGHLPVRLLAPASTPTAASSATPTPTGVRPLFADRFAGAGHPALAAGVRRARDVGPSGERLARILDPAVGGRGRPGSWPLLIGLVVVIVPGPARIPVERRRPGASSGPSALASVADAATDSIERLIRGRGGNAATLAGARRGQAAA